MDLPDCPPGAEGYQDSVTEVPKKPELDESSCTKAEYEFQEHLNSLKIRLEDGGTRCMVERRGRDISGKWIYLCYPCAAVCSGESILQTHISGKKHKIKLSMRNVWPNSIFDDHPFNQTTVKTGATEKVLQRMAEEVDNHNRNPSNLDQKYNKYRTVTCHIQDSLDAVKAPLLGVEYLIEHPPEQSHYEPTYMCTLCNKQGHPRTIINHMTCFWHRYNYLVRHFSTACGMLAPYRSQTKYRDGVNVIMNRLAQRIEDKYGRKRPVNIDKEEYEKDKVQIHEWVFRSHHFNEKDGPSFTEVVDIGLIDSLLKSNEESKPKGMGKDKREPSPPVVAAPSKPLFNNFSDPDAAELVDLTAIFLLPSRRKRKRPPTRTAQRARERAKREAKREAQRLLLNPIAADLATTKVAATLATPKVAATLATPKVAATLAATKAAATLATPKVAATLATPKSAATLATPKVAATLVTTKAAATQATPKVAATLATPKSAATPAPPKARSVPAQLGLSPMVITEINKPVPSISPELDTVVYQMDLTISPTRPSAPVPPAPVYSKPLGNRPAGRQERRAGSVESLSDISDDDNDNRRDPGKDRRVSRDRHDSFNKVRFEPYDKRRGASPPRSRQASRLQPSKSQEKQQRPPNYEYKVKLAEEKRQSVEDSLKKTLAYHEKNPEKHPLYPEEWKKFWNRRYKEIQAEGKDPSKHDFKPEWIIFWTARMKELHEEELRIQVMEIYRRMCLSPPDMSKRVSIEKTHAPEPHRKLSEPRRKSPVPRRKSPEPRRRSPDPRRRSPEPRRRSPDPRRRSPDPRRRSPDRRHPERYDRLREPLPPRRRTPPPDRRDRRSPLPHPPRRSPPRRRTPERRHSPPPPVHQKRTRSRSPLHRRSPARTHIALDSIRRSSRSPLSQREQQRNRSPEHAARALAPSLQTVLISDDELKPDDGLSPWNSDNDIESVGSAPRSRADSHARRRRSVSGGAGAGLWPAGAGLGPAETALEPAGAADDVVATLRQLVALEDYLGSLGPKIVDLLADALKMEKEKANSSEELLERDSAVVLIETAKEKLKGAVQAGLVGGSAAHALRAAVVRAAATLHEADKRTRLKQKQNPAPSKTAAVPVAVAGVGQVDRAQIAQQMAEALIAQGKTDVSSEDLAVLVDAVVGMAEAKKRAAEQTKKVVPTPVVEKPVIRPVLPKQSGTASALQMLQSAYDENDKKMDSSNTPDAMDGLSDSDLETLLKNFNELSAEEQHSLIAYLKKLEAKEPERVERLRQYVSEAASTAPKELTPEENKEPEEKPAKTVVLESDDDDYTVEEVFKSATQKVKEDQIRHEMEIVKKSLEETKPEPTTVEPAKLENSLADITRSLSTSSATDLFALVQASIKSTAATPAPLSHASNVVVSNTQPRSFGDLPEPTVTQEPSKPVQSDTGTTPFNNQAQGPEPGRTPFQSLQGLLRPSARFQAPQQQQQQQRPQQQNYQSPQHNQQNYQSSPLQQQNYQPPQQNQQQNYQPPQQNQQDNYQPPQQNQQNYQPPQQNQQQNYQPPQQNQQDNYQPPQQNQQNYQPPQQNQQNYQPPQQNQQQNYQPPQRNQQQNYQPSQQNQQQPLYNQGQQKNYQPPQHNQGPQHNQLLPSLAQRNQPQHQQYTPPQHQQYQPPQHQQQHFNDNRNMASDNFNQGQWNPRPNNMDNRGPPMRGPAPDNFGHNAPYNQGPRNNFMNGRGQDNYDTRPPMNQQFGNNYDNNQSNFRGRGGGRGNFRGRGRGYY